MSWIADHEMEIAMDMAEECEMISNLSNDEITKVLFDYIDEDGEFCSQREKINSICNWYKEKGHLTEKQRLYLNHTFQLNVIGYF